MEGKRERFEALRGSERARSEGERLEIFVTPAGAQRA